MSAITVGKQLVELCQQGQFSAAVDQLYAADVVSIEGQGTAEMPARLEGIEAVRGKGQWWEANHEIHGFVTTGPFVGHRDDQFIVRFEMDVTPKGGDRMAMSECALYTVKDEKVAQEEFLYQVD